MNKILLIDGHSILNRAFYGLPDLTNTKGQHTNAVLGFLNIFLKLVEDEKPTHVFVAFDVHQPTFRHLMYDEYKGTRKGMPEELREQVPLLKDMLRAMQVTTIEQGGYEADDILGTLSRIAEKQGYQVTIVSGDRDLLQLATDSILVRIPKTKSGGTVIEDYYAKDVLEKYQVTPTEFIDLKGLMGDASDNIKGVPGIGEKTATKIITEFHSIENAYAHIEEVKPNKAKENLMQYYEQAIFSKELATIKLDCELPVTLSDGRLQELFTPEAYTLFKELEFKQLLKHFEQTKAQQPELDYTLISDRNTAADAVDKFISAGRPLGIYAYGNAGHILALSVSTEDTSYVFTVQDAGITPIEAMLKPQTDLTSAYLEELVKTLLSENSDMATMNLKKLLHLMQAERKDFYSVFDVSVAAYLLNPLKQTYNYDDISRDYLGQLLPSMTELIGKKEITTANLQDEQFLSYMSYSAIVARQAVSPLTQALQAEDMWSLYQEIELPCVYTLYHMEAAGVKIDKNALISYSKMLDQEITVLRDRIYQACGEEFNILSPKQLGVILFEKMGLPGGKKTKTGYSTSADVLDKLKGEYPVVRDILDYRTYSKLKSTYADGLTNFIAPDGRIYGCFHQTITATGRISSTDPNLQNIPMRLDVGREIRKAFIPEEGYVYVDADYSQIELRVMAHMSADPILLNAYKQGLDIHASTAAEVFDIPLDEVTPLQRRHAKVVNFGIIYGQSAFGLSQELNISRGEAKEYIDKYFATYTEVQRFLKESVERAKEQGFVTTLWKRKRPVPEISSSNFMQRNFGERIAMNSPIQGSAADIIKIAMVRVDRELIRRGLKSRLVLQIHDELLIETLKEELDEVMALLKEQMENAAKLSVSLDVDMHTGTNWFEAK